MIEIKAAASENVATISCWLGLNENQDGDTLLKSGEAAEMRNFRITRDGSLQKRPGYRTIHTTRTWTGAIGGIWHGFISGTAHTLFAAGGKIYEYDFSTNAATSVMAAGTSFTAAATAFFGFGDKVYAMNGHEYLEWDGAVPPAGGFAAPTGYRPLVAVATPPAGGGTLMESVNRLNGLRRVRFSPTGSATAFVLSEKNLASIDYVRNLVTNTDYTPTTDYSVNLATGTVTFGTAPSAGTNTIEIAYTFPTDYRSQVAAMRFCEIFNGAQDTRVFLYGDGSNKALYSGIDMSGLSRADYWPDLNDVHVGEANTALTALIRHYSSMVAFKTDSAYAVDYGQITLESGALTSAFYVTPINRAVGNAAPGQVRLVNNNPWTLFGAAAYEWYISGTSNDERLTNRRSDRVKDTMSALDLSEAAVYDDNERQELYILQGGTALVYSYASDAWYKYTGFDFTALITVEGALYGCTPAGDIAQFSRAYNSDNGAAIDCYWRSGSMAFKRDWTKKFSGLIFVTIKPEALASVAVTLATNKKSLYPKKIAAYGFTSFCDANFGHWGFATSTKPQTQRLKIKAKKFTYYQLIFESNDDWSTATILSTDIKLRYSGDVK